MSIGRPREFNPDKVLDLAMGVFWRQGYEATSLPDLLKAMKLSKSSLYQSFGNKQALFVRCLQRYQEQTVASLHNRLSAAESGRKFIRETLLWVIEEAAQPTAPRGCLTMNTASEFAQSNGTIAQHVTEGIDAFQRVFRDAVLRSQQEGDIDDTKNPALLANYLVSSMGGLRTMVKAGTDVKTLRNIVDVIMAALD